MPDWTAFLAVAGLVLTLVLGLARVTTATVGDGDERELAGPGTVCGEPRASADAAVAGDAEYGGAAAEAPGSLDADEAASPGTDARPVASAATAEPRAEPSLEDVSTGMLFLNVLFTHGVLAAVLLAAAGLTDVPWDALGVAVATADAAGGAIDAAAGALGWGIALGLALALANGVLAANLDRFGIEHDEALRRALAPDGRTGWAALLFVVLPLVALFEELLFRGVLIGALAAWSGLSPWLFVVPSSLAFAACHGLQGRGGLLVTGLLGGVLGAAFAVTDSLLLVIVAHYVVNAAEFTVREWLGVEVGERLAV